jgi:hypothetical protein
MGMPYAGMLNGITGCCMAVIGDGAVMGIMRGMAGMKACGAGVQGAG